MAARVQAEAAGAQQALAAETVSAAEKTSQQTLADLTGGDASDRGVGEVENAKVIGTVARGRTLRQGGVELDENRNVKRVWHKDFGPGAEVEVSPEEHAALVASGVFVDPAGKAVKVQTGANVGVFAGS